MWQPSSFCSFASSNPIQLGRNVALSCCIYSTIWVCTTVSPVCHKLPLNSTIALGTGAFWTDFLTLLFVSMKCISSAGGRLHG